MCKKKKLKYHIKKSKLKININIFLFKMKWYKNIIFYNKIVNLTQYILKPLIITREFYLCHYEFLISL